MINLEDLKAGTQIICIKDMSAKKGKLFFKSGVYTICCQLNPKLAEDTFKIYNPVSLFGDTQLDLKTINEYFVLFDLNVASKLFEQR